MGWKKRVTLSQVCHHAALNDKTLCLFFKPLVSGAARRTSTHYNAKNKLL